MKGPERRTLRDIGGKNTEYPRPNDDTATEMQRILESTPSYIVAGLLVRNERFGEAMEELLNQNIFTQPQYDAIGAEIDRQIQTGEFQQEHVKFPHILHHLLQYTRADVSMRVREALGHESTLDVQA